MTNAYDFLPFRIPGKVFKMRCGSLWVIHSMVIVVLGLVGFWLMLIEKIASFFSREEKKNPWN